MGTYGSFSSNRRIRCPVPQKLDCCHALSNFGTFLLYGVTCIVAVFALSRERRSILTKYVIPIAGFVANMVMLVAVIWLGVIGGGDTQWAAFVAISITAIWMLIGFGYFAANSRSKSSKIFPFPGKELEEDKGKKYSIRESGASEHCQVGLDLFFSFCRINRYTCDILTF